MHARPVHARTKSGQDAAGLPHTQAEAANGFGFTLTALLLGLCLMLSLMWLVMNRMGPAACADAATGSAATTANAVSTANASGTAVDSTSAHQDLCPMQLTLLAVHPDARRQRTTTGRTLATLVWHAGRLYAGYGDYGANTGPIRLRTLSPENRYFSPPLATLPTEAVYEFRPFRGQLLVPNIDLRGRLGPAAFIGSGPHWTPSPDITSTHVFDALLVGPDEVWLLGSVGREPAVWHWRVASGRIERIPTPTRRPDAAFSRATGAFEYKGEMCVYFQQVASIGETDVQCWSGRAWQPGPTVFPDDATFADMALTRPTPFADGIVYTDTHTGVSRIPSRLYYLPTDVAEGGSTPARFRYAFGPAGQFEDAGKTAYVRDFYLDDGTLWLLNALAEVWRSNTPGAWERVGRIALPRGERAASLAVNAGRLFIGTDRAQVYEVTPHPPVDATHSSLQ